MADKRELLFILKGKDQGAKKAFDDLGDAAEDARDDADDMRSGLRALDGQLAKSRTQVEGLRKEISKSGDLGLIKDLERAQREVNKLSKQRKLLVGEDEGRESAEQFSVGFVARVGPLLARAPLSPPLAGAIAAGAPLIASAVSAAVTAGVGLAAVGAGLKIAFQDPSVKAAGKALGDEVGELLTQSAQPFVPATLRAIDIVRKEFRTMEPELDRIFGASAPWVPRLAAAGAKGGHEFARGFADAVENADPAIRVLEYHIPQAAEAAGDSLSALSKNAEYNSDVLSAALTSAEFSVVHFANSINLLSQVSKISFVGGLIEATNGLRGTEKVLKDIPASTSAVTNEFGRLASSAAAAARTYAAAAAAIADQNLSAAESTLRYRDAVDAARDSVDRKRQVSQEEDQALIDLARSSNTLIESLDRQGASAGELGKKHQTARSDLIKAAEAAGYTSDKAEELADDYLAIPRRVDTLISAETATAEDNLRAVRDLIARIKSKRVVITVDYHGRESIRVGGRNVPIGSLGGLSEGGYVDGPGPKGKDSELRALAPGEYVLPDDIVDKVGVTALDSLRRGDMDAWARQAGAAMPAPSPRRAMAAGHGGAVRGGAPFGWAGMERSFVQFLVSAISGAGGDPSVLRIGRGRA